MEYLWDGIYCLPLDQGFHHFPLLWLSNIWEIFPFRFKLDPQSSTWPCNYIWIECLFVSYKKKELYYSMKVVFYLAIIYDVTYSIKIWIIYKMTYQSVFIVSHVYTSPMNRSGLGILKTTTASLIALIPIIKRILGR